MAQVDGEVYLIVLWNVENVFFVLHVYRDKFVAYLWSMFSVINQTKLFCFDIQLQLRVGIESNAFAFDLLSPTVLVEAFSEEDYVGHHSLVVILVDSIAHAVEIQSEYFIYKHLLSILISKVVIIALPSLGVSILRQSLSTLC